MHTQLFEPALYVACDPQSGPSGTQPLPLFFCPDGHWQPYWPPDDVHVVPRALHLQVSPASFASGPQLQLLSYVLYVAPGALHTQAPFLSVALLPQLGVGAGFGAGAGPGAGDEQAPFWAFWPKGQAQEYLPEPSLDQLAFFGLEQTQELPSEFREAPSPQPQLLSEALNVAPGALHTHVLPSLLREALVPQLEANLEHTPFWAC